MKRRRELIVLIVLLAVFAVVAWYQWNRVSQQQAGAVAPNAQGRRGRQADRVGVPAVRLDELAAARKAAAPAPPERNLFRFEVKAAPPPPPAPGQPGATGAPGQAAGQPAGPPPPPPPPPIQLKFIGIVQAPNQKLAVLTDPTTRDVFYGREGDIVDGRFRILRIGIESIEMAYVDGRGRQSIRLSGS